MATLYADVLRVTDTLANVVAAIRSRQIGMATDSPYKLVGSHSGTKRYWSSDDGDRTQTGAITITKTTTQLVARYDSTHSLSVAVDADGDATLTPTRHLEITTAASGNVTINTGSVDSDLTVNWDTGVALFVQGSDGYVGVGGIAVPLAKLHVFKDAADGDAIANSVVIVEGGSTGANISLLSDEGVSSTIAFDDQWLSGGAKIVYDTDPGTGSAYMSFAIGGHELLRLNRPAGVDVFVINEPQNDVDTIIRTGGDSAMFVADGSLGKIGISTATMLAAKLTILQDDASGESCLSLSQADASEGVIDFVASNRGAILATTNSVASVRVELNGTVYRIPLHADA
jgi:hypothetical protein